MRRPCAPAAPNRPSRNRCASPSRSINGRVGQTRTWQVDPSSRDVAPRRAHQEGDNERLLLLSPALSSSVGGCCGARGAQAGSSPSGQQRALLELSRTKGHWAAERAPRRSRARSAPKWPSRLTSGNLTHSAGARGHPPIRTPARLARRGEPRPLPGSRDQGRSCSAAPAAALIGTARLPRRGDARVVNRARRLCAPEPLAASPRVAAVEQTAVVAGAPA